MNKRILFLLVILIGMIDHTDLFSQDQIFTQWEYLPAYTNPALTGDFDGLASIRIKYRDLNRRSVVGPSSGIATANGVAAAYKFGKSDSRKFSVGLYSVGDEAGSVSFKTRTTNLSAAVIQNLGNPEDKHHTVAVGFSGGYGKQSINLDDAQWPIGPPSVMTEDINSSINYADVSTGIDWQYHTNTHFTFQIGAALHHLNRPNISFFESGIEKRYTRFNLHGSVELPLGHDFSFVPAFHLYSQGPSEQLLFGFGTKWYLKGNDIDFIQAGILAKSTNNFDGRDVNIFVLSTSIEIKSILVGFSYDYFERANWDAFEFSLGYVLGRGVVEKVME